jgi:hypothetical protein
MNFLNLSVKETSEYMIKYHIEENEMIQSGRNKLSPFGLISQKITGKYCFRTTMKLLMQWKRNQKGKNLIEKIS